VIAGLAVFLALAAGFGLPFTALGLGGALALGATLTLLTLFCATVFAGLAVSSAVWLTLGLALITGAVGWRMCRPSLPLWWATHPALCLPLLVVVTGLIAGVPSYLPVNWDEMSGWATWVRQILAADVWWRADMQSSYAGYTKGWPILAAAMNRLLGSGELGIGIGALTAWHALVLGAAYDVTIRMLERRPGLAAPTRRGLAWVFLLVLVLGEASWKLLPHSYLVEDPQLYTAIAFLCFGAMALQAPAAGRTRLLALAAAGLSMAAAYSVKTPMAALAAAALVFLVMTPANARRASLAAIQRPLRPRPSGRTPAPGEGQTGRSIHWPAVIAGDRRRLASTTALFLPLAVVMLGWSLVRPPLPSDSLDLQAGLAALPGILSRLMVQFPAYLLSWKLPMTAVGVLGLVVALGRRGGDDRADRRGLAAALVAYSLVVWIGLIPLYTFVIGSWEEALPSLPRYMGVPLRLIHLFGCLLVGVELAGWAGKLAPVLRWADGRAGRAALLLAIAALTGVQAVMTARAIAAMGDHPDFGREAFLQVRKVVDAVPAITLALARSGEIRPDVAVIDQGGDGFAVVILQHYSVRGPGDSQADVHRFHVVPAWSFGPQPTNGWMRKADGEAFRSTIAKAPVIWINHLDPWARAELSPLVGDCADELEGRVLLRNAGGRFDCQ
jgi:hypothetical protein